MVSSVDDQGRPIITVGLIGMPNATYLCSALQQVRQQNGSYDIRRKSDLVMVGNTTVAILEIDVVGA